MRCGKVYAVAGSVLISLYLFMGCSQGPVSSNASNPDAISNQRASDVAKQEELRKLRATQWVLAASEDFEQLTIPAAKWQADQPSAMDSYDDAGSFFVDRDKALGFKTPGASRATLALGVKPWIFAEAYTRDLIADAKQPLSIATDPSGSAGNHVLRLESETHTDAAILRSVEPLPAEYRACVRVKLTGNSTTDKANSGVNNAEPWVHGAADSLNGFYWISIFSDLPMPHNSLWVNHKRKAAIHSLTTNASDLDPISMMAFDSRGPISGGEFDYTGPSCISWVDYRFNYSAQTGVVPPAASYVEGRWYDACIEKTDKAWQLSVTGIFRGEAKPRMMATFPIERTYPLDSHHPLDPPGSPDYLVLGDPLINYGSGTVYFDDLRIYTRLGVTWPPTP